MIKNFTMERNYETINFPLPPKCFYLSYDKLNNICHQSYFKELYYLSTEKSDLVYEIKCKENLEFQNLTLSNDEIIERFEKIIKNNLGQRKLIISYKEKDEKDKALSLLNYLNLSNYRDTNNNIEDCMDDLDVIDLVLLPIEAKVLNYPY